MAIVCIVHGHRHRVEHVTADAPLYLETYILFANGAPTHVSVLAVRIVFSPLVTRRLGSKRVTFRHQRSFSEVRQYGA